MFEHILNKTRKATNYLVSWEKTLYFREAAYTEVKTWGCLQTLLSHVVFWGELTLFCYKYSEVVAEDGVSNFESRIKSLKLLEKALMEVVFIENVRALPFLISFEHFIKVWSVVELIT